MDKMMKTWNLKIVHNFLPAVFVDFLLSQEE